MPSRLRESIESGRRKRGLAFLPFLAAGFPDSATFLELLRRMGEVADAVEIGFPFSDPIADGPAIQSAFAQTLERGFAVADVFAAVREAKASLQTPLVAMVSYSIVYRYGLERFLQDCREACFDGVLLPDLPPPEAQSVCPRIHAQGLDTVLLVAPTSTLARRREITGLCSGFVYYLSVSGLTGERDELPGDLQRQVGELKSLTDLPVCVGFGVSKSSHIKQLSGVADGVIVGSAIVRMVSQQTGRSAEEIAESVVKYCRELTYVTS
ncbi:MAG: tryptophan synthase subunit alpha [Phycisphaerae bacterium]|nr:tryptophan synthase subunit alpha [Phycisphaerae bacterium]MDW8263605.1 tryptophan synthase subunit alpha [Phycisphaerales bacterium]